MSTTVLKKTMENCSELHFVQRSVQIDDILSDIELSGQLWAALGKIGVS